MQIRMDGRVLQRRHHHRPGHPGPGLGAVTGLVIWGFEPQGWIFAIFLTTYALVTVNIAEGVRALPKDLIDMSRAFGVDQLATAA